MKNVYEEIEIEVICFDNSDIVTTSGDSILTLDPTNLDNAIKFDDTFS